MAAVGAVIFCVTTWLTLLVQPLDPVTTTEYVPGTLTVIEAVVFPFDHK